MRLGVGMDLRDWNKVVDDRDRRATGKAWTQRGGQPEPQLARV